jgi:hypothetical protein
MVSAPAPVALAAPDPSFGAPDVRLHRLTPQACVYSAVELHAIFGHVLPDARMAATLNGHLDFRMRRADGSIVCAPDITVQDVALPGPCHVCTVTRMQDVGSRRLHPSVARSRRATRSSLSAAAVSFAPPVALSALCGGAGGLGSLLLPVSLSAAGPGLPDVDLPEETAPAVSAGSSSSSSSESESERSAGTAPEGSDADVDPECDVGRPPVFTEYPDRLYPRAGALGSAARTFAAMESLPWERRAGRLVHFDVIYPEHASRGRPLKGGVTCYLLGFDLGVQCALLRPLKHKSDLRRAFKALAVQQHWATQGHVAHIVTDGEPALAAALEEAALDMGCSFEVLPAYAPNANHAGAGLVKSLRSAARAYLFEASAHPGAAIDGSFEPFALEQAVHMFNVSAIPAHPLVIRRTGCSTEPRPCSWALHLVHLCTCTSPRISVRRTLLAVSLLVLLGRRLFWRLVLGLRTRCCRRASRLARLVAPAAPCTWRRRALRLVSSLAARRLKCLALCRSLML